MYQLQYQLQKTCNNTKITFYVFHNLEFFPIYILAKSVLKYSTIHHKYCHSFCYCCNKRLILQVWLKKDDDRWDPLLMQKRKHTKDSLMVFAAISVDGPVAFTILEEHVTADSYLATLKKHIIPRLKKRPNSIWQEDNAPPHKAKKVKQYLKDEKISVLEWPPKSPDLSPIEIIWGYMKRELNKNFPATKDQLRRKLPKVFKQVATPEQCRMLIESFPKRVKKCCEAEGNRFKC